jgi:hypothetical protein
MSNKHKHETGSNVPSPVELPDATPAQGTLPTFAEVRDALLGRIAQTAEKDTFLAGYKSRGQSVVRALALYFGTQIAAMADTFAKHAKGYNAGFKEWRGEVVRKLLEGATEGQLRSGRTQCSQVWAIWTAKDVKVLEAARPFREAWEQGIYDETRSYGAAREAMKEARVQGVAATALASIRRMLKGKVEASQRAATLRAIADGLKVILSDVEIVPQETRIPAAPEVPASQQVAA